jgi:type 1 glutamine amidotransferase
MSMRLFFLTAAFALLLPPRSALAQPAQRSGKTIVLIGGDTPHGPGVHDARNGILRIAHDLETSPEIRAMGDVAIRAYPDGWPGDPRALDRASTIVWYFDGLEHHPLNDRARRHQIARLMRRGVGLVTFHQASTLLPSERRTDLVRWLGGARYGMVDRTVETASFVPADHPVSRGVGPFTYRDEFYPSIRFGHSPVTPILTSALHLEAAPAARPTIRTVAWAFERPGGGRSFGFTGLHYLASLDQLALRTLLLNAIVWTAGIEVPPHGITTETQGK